MSAEIDRFVSLSPDTFSCHSPPASLWLLSVSESLLVSFPRLSVRSSSVSARTRLSCLGFLFASAVCVAALFIVFFCLLFAFSPFLFLLQSAPWFCFRHLLVSPPFSLSCSSSLFFFLSFVLFCLVCVTFLPVCFLLLDLCFASLISFCFLVLPSFLHAPCLRVLC